MEQKKSILLKRARAKFLSSNLSCKLIENNPESDLIKSYRNSFYCSDVFIQKGKTLTTTYCKNRWCATCNRIRTAVLINGYLPVIKAFGDAYFVTLTLKTVEGSELRSRVDYMVSTFRSILKSRAARKMNVRGVRKLECTLRPNNKFHPHFHLIVDSKEAAEFILLSWLRINGGLADRKAQDLVKADENSLKELFKYFTKLIDPGTGSIEFGRLDSIFVSIRNKRIYQPFGGIKSVSEEIDSITSESFDMLEDCEELWKWSCNDWVNQSGELLTGYSPSERFKQFFL
jgi:hypothetical protein